MKIFAPAGPSDESTSKELPMELVPPSATPDAVPFNNDTAVEAPVQPALRFGLARTALLGAQRTSMLQDVDAGRPLETEAILGAVVEIADRVGADVPVTRHLYALVRLLDRSLERERAGFAPACTA